MTSQSVCLSIIVIIREVDYVCERHSIHDVTDDYLAGRLPEETDFDSDGCFHLLLCAYDPAYRSLISYSNENVMRGSASTKQKDAYREIAQVRAFM